MSKTDNPLFSAKENLIKLIRSQSITEDELPSIVESPKELTELERTLETSRNLLTKEFEVVSTLFSPFKERRLEVFDSILQGVFSSSKEDLDILSSSAPTFHGRFSNQDTLLMRAIKTDQMDIAKMLIAKGVDVDVKTGQKGISALHAVVSMPGDKKSCVDLLFRAGADLNIRTDLIRAPRVGDEDAVMGGKTPLILAIERHLYLMARRLLTPLSDPETEGADPNLYDFTMVKVQGEFHTHLTPLIWAIKTQNERMVELLLRHKDTDVWLSDEIVGKNTKNWSPLMWAAEVDDKNIVGLLLKKMLEDVAGKRFGADLERLKTYLVNSSLTVAEDWFYQSILRLLGKLIDSENPQEN